MVNMSALQQLIKGNYLVSRLMIGVLIIGALGAGAGYYQRLSSYRFTTITEGQVYQSAAMPPEALNNKVRQYGIKTVIDFRRPSDKVDVEHSVLTQLGIRHFNLSSGQIPEDEVADEFLKIMDNREYRPVLIHCKHGIGRAVLFSAIYRMEYEGWSNENARRKAYWQSGFGGFKSTEKKGKFIRDYIPRRLLTTQLSYNAAYP